MITEKQFKILSLTWGLPLTTVGLATSAVLMLTGHEPKKYGWSYYFELGENWGGCEIGPVFIKCRNSGDKLCEHEFGHAIQNCMYGPLMPFIVNAPSSTRYWARRAMKRAGRKPKSGYYDIWFEKQASELGKQYAEHIKDEETVVSDK